MFEEVLKFGSMIVDALVAYQNPIFVYIPPFAELRGGAWVVVDHTINADVMEFYAAEDARGGVLEAAGAASIKYREKDILKTMHRLDHGLGALDKKLLEAKEGGNDAAIESVMKEISTREKMLFGVYQQVAEHFADLHDTPGRMKAKEVIRAEVKWRDSRKYFYWRLRRRITEFELARKLASADESKAKLSTFRQDVIESLRAWFNSLGGTQDVWDDDRKMMLWLTDHNKDFSSFIEGEKAGLIATSLSNMIVNSTNEELARVLSKLPKGDRSKILAALK